MKIGFRKLLKFPGTVSQMHIHILTLEYITQGIDGSARRPALRQDTGYMVEKTYLDIAPYWAFGAYLMPQ